MYSDSASTNFILRKQVSPWLSTLKIFAKSLVLGLLVLTFFPTLFFLRLFVNQLSKLLRKDFDCMVRPWDLTFCIDYERWHTEPERTVLCSNILDSGVTLEEIYSRYEKAIQKWSNRKLRQRIKIWMGYLFWKNDPDFQLEDHIKLYEDDKNNSNEVIRDEKWLTKLKQELLRKPYLKDKSPWEVLLVPNFKSDIDPDKEFCVIFWRLHHVLGDGVSLRNITLELMDEMPPVVKPNFPSSKKNFIVKSIERLLFLLKSPYIFLKTVDESNDENKSTWNNKEFKFSKISSSAKSKQISLPYLKDIKNKYNVSLNSVILLGVSSIIRRAFIKAKIKLPDRVHCVFPIPLPNHPDELCHHATILPLGFPIGTSDPEERLGKIDKDLSKFKNSLIPPVIVLLASITGRLPYIFLKLPSKFFLTGSVTIFPGAIERRPMLGRNYYCENFCLSVYSPTSFTGLFITCFTNNTTLDIDSHFDRSIFNLDSDVEELYEALYEDYKKISSSEDMFTKSKRKS